MDNIDTVEHDSDLILLYLGQFCPLSVFFELFSDNKLNADIIQKISLDQILSRT